MKIAVWSTFVEQYRRLDGFCNLGPTFWNNIDAFAGFVKNLAFFHPLFWGLPRWSTLLEQYRRFDAFCNLGPTFCNNIDAFAGGFIFCQLAKCGKKCLFKARGQGVYYLIKTVLRGKIRALRGIVILSCLSNKETSQEFHFTRNNLLKVRRCNYEQS